MRRCARTTITPQGNGNLPIPRRFIRPSGD
jgi:hypothetical protein